MTEEDTLIQKVAKWIWRQRWIISLSCIIIPFSLVIIPSWLLYLLSYEVWLQYDKVTELLIPLYGRLIGFGSLFLIVAVVVEIIKKVSERKTKNEA